MATLGELQDRLERLREARALGTGAVQFEGGARVEYRSDADLAAAIADVERQMAAATATPVHTIKVSASKGLET